MKKIDEIYDAVDDYGLITSAEAVELGVPNTELVQFADRGKLLRVARGVYRVPVWPYQEQSPYAIAVKAVGPGAYLYGESVVALLDLAPTDPRVIWVASPKRVRRNLGDGVRVVVRRAPQRTERYEGILCQAVAGAIAAATTTLGPKRAAQAADAASREGLITPDERRGIEREMTADV